MTLSPAGFETLAGLLKSRSGLVIGPDKLYLLETRLAPILRRDGLRDLATLADRLRTVTLATEALARDVVEAMTTNESFFFRDEKPFQHVRTVALPRLLAARTPGTPLRNAGRRLASAGSRSWGPTLPATSSPGHAMGSTPSSRSNAACPCKC